VELVYVIHECLGNNDNGKGMLERNEMCKFGELVNHNQDTVEVA
jgi:hypothetical protein